jgi:glycosyltransferase involved in cell wall biosynthesis
VTELNLLYVHSMATGYGRYGTMLARSLEDIGVKVYDDLEESLPQRSARVFAGTSEQKRCNVTCWVSTPSHCRGFWEGQHAVLATMWEAMRLPEGFVKNLHEFETVIVPSWQNVELFSEHHPNVKFVPLGIDPERWNFVGRKPPGRFFNFLIAGHGQRKGLDLAREAFYKVWPKEGSWGGGPIPRLVMKTSAGGDDLMGPRIEIVSGRLTEEEEVDLYADAHCYLQPSRGEGFGLQPLQAMAQGIPTVLTDAHGHESFAHLGWGLTWKPSKAHYFVYGDAGDWWEPSLEDLCDHMRNIYDDYTSACSLAEVSARIVGRDWTWRRTAEKTVDAIGRDVLDVPYSGSCEWHKIEQKKFLVITKQDFTAHSVGSTYQFKKGQEYYEPESIKRILFGADMLDPRCLTGPDHGLAPAQVEAMGLPSASQGYCHACGQRLNTLPTRTDDILKELEREDRSHGS